MAEADKYDVLEKIGHGSFGVIRKVRRKADGQIMCRKEISYIRMSQKEREQLHAEFSILSSLRHPNIVAYYQREHLKATQDLHLYMEYCGNGDLGRVIKQLKVNNQYAEEDFVWSIFAQLVTALYRCHYGVDAPDVGRNVTVLRNDPKPKASDGKRQVMILHRDLKPENVFLGEDNSVKLGDFGLSKILQSHDFASTYVGTPFYMSPEICAAERYTLHSDVWSLGCIMYELCAKSPPFMAKSHFQLVQKIKDGRFPPLPAIYSQELQAVIQSCLQVNPKNRPDTACLLNLPVVRLMRKEKEVVELGKVLKSKEELLGRRLKESEERERRLHAEHETLRAEMEARLKQEWETRARLEIERRVQAEVQRLSVMFDIEVQQKVQMEVNKQMQLPTRDEEVPAAVSSEIPSSSLSGQEETDFPSTTDLSELSLNSPVLTGAKPEKQGTRTPFGRSQTMFLGSPMDVQMVDPSPISIASLSLSPRRQATTAAGYRNIFAAAAGKSHALAFAVHSDNEDEEEDASHVPPSPTHPRPAKNPFTTQRPALVTQRTAPVPKLKRQAEPSSITTGRSQPPAGLLAPLSQSDPRTGESDGSALLSKRSTSPSRRTSNVAALATLSANETGSPVRRAKRATAAPAHRPVGGEEMFKAVTKNNMMKGRSLVELAQARAGVPATGRLDRTASDPVRSTTRDLTAEVGGKTSEMVWDPERDEMPSPFLVRGGRGLRRT